MSSSDEQSVGQAQQEDWDEWEEGEGDEHVKSLFSEAVFPSVVGALRADAASHGFDLRKYVLQVRAARARHAAWLWGRDARAYRAHARKGCPTAPS
jgi:hypothetical protein